METNLCPKRGPEIISSSDCTVSLFEKLCEIFVSPNHEGVEKILLYKTEGRGHYQIVLKINEGLPGWTFLLDTAMNIVLGV